MKRLTRQLKSFAADDSGATAIEYALIAALIAIGMIGGLQLMADGTESMWGKTTTAVTNEF